MQKFSLGIILYFIFSSVKLPALESKSTIYFVNKNLPGNTSTSLGEFLCGNPFSDSRDGKVYKTVLIGTQCWMQENLNVGSRIDSNVNQTNNKIIEKFCQNNLESNCDIYGGLYQWDEMMNYETMSKSIPSGRQGICPFGWHIPSNAEWKELITYLGGTSVAGAKMKEAGLIHWGKSSAESTNSSGFTALPGGALEQDRFYRFVNFPFYAHFWSSSWISEEQGAQIFYYLSYNDELAHLSFNYFKSSKSVRCIKD